MERQDFINSLSSKDSIIESLKTSLAAVLETLESLNRQMEQQRSQFQTEQLNSQSLIEQLRSQFQLEQSRSQSLIKDLTNEINSLFNDSKVSKTAAKDVLRDSIIESFEERLFIKS
jgi:predicted  nucleic acid-binding Zn-ribbon protein